MSDDFAGFTVANTIEQLRAELSRAMDAAKGKELRFSLEEIDLEFQMALSEDEEVKGGIDFKVISAGGRSTITDHTVHTLKLKLKPVAEQRGQPEKSDGAPPERRGKVLVSDDTGKITD